MIEGITAQKPDFCRASNQSQQLEQAIEIAVMLGFCDAAPLSRAAPGDLDIVLRTRP